MRGDGAPSGWLSGEDEAPGNRSIPGASIFSATRRLDMPACRFRRRARGGPASGGRGCASRREVFAGSEAGAGIAADIDLGAATREARFKRAPIRDRALARAIRAGGETRAGAFIARRRQFTLRLRPPGCTPTVRKRIRRDRARMHRSLPHRPSAPVIPAAARMAARPVAESSAGLSAHACRPCSSGAIFGSPSGSPRTQGKRPVFLRTRAFALIWWRIRDSRRMSGNPAPAKPCGCYTFAG